MSTTSNIKTILGAKPGDLFKGPNLLSLSRVLVAILIIWTYEVHEHRLTWELIVLVVYGILSDYLDGYWARRRGEVSDLGNAIDPATDKFGSGLLFLYAVWIGRIPVLYLLFIVARDLVIMSVSLYIRKITGTMPKAIISGKISINAVAAYWVATFFAPEAHVLVSALMWLSIALMIYSLGDYMVRYWRTYRIMTKNESN